MKLISLLAIALVPICLMTVAATEEGCANPPPPQTVQTDTNLVLNATQIACIFASTLTSVPGLATACKIESSLVPGLEALITQLVGQREGAKKSGVAFKAPTH